MRRAKPISVRVRAPSRGVVTRLPGETADQLPAQGGLAPGTRQRAAAVASNVRYEDGVVCNAPGYSVVTVGAGIREGLVAHWNLDETTSPRLDSSGNGHTLSETAGLDVSGGDVVVPVGYETGKFLNAALLASIPPYACPVYTPLTITWSNGTSNYGILSVEADRKLFIFRTGGTSKVSILSTVSDSYIGFVDLSSAVFASISGFVGIGLVYAPAWGLVFAVDQRGYYAAFDPVTGVLTRTDDPPNQVATSLGPAGPPAWYDMAFDSDRGLMVWSPTNSSTVTTVPLAGTTGAYTSDDFTGLSWGNHRAACCYNPAVKKVVFCSDGAASFPYWFFDTGTGAAVASSLTIGSFSTVWYIADKNVIVGSATNGTVYVIDAATDTVLASSSAVISGDLGGAVFNPCAGTSGLVYAVTQGNNLLSFDPSSAWAETVTTLGFTASAMARDKWAGALYVMVNDSETVHKV